VSLAQICSNDGCFVLREVLVPDPPLSAGATDVDGRGRDPFVRELLRRATAKLATTSEAQPARAQRLWTVSGVPVLTRDEVVAAGTVVVGVGATEKFRASATL
jgi:hypothetical protein